MIYRNLCLSVGSMCKHQLAVTVTDSINARYICTKVAVCLYRGTVHIKLQGFKPDICGSRLSSCTKKYLVALYLFLLAVFFVNNAVLLNLKHLAGKLEYHSSFFKSIGEHLAYFSICRTCNLGHHFNNSYLCTHTCKVVSHFKTYYAAADNNHFLRKCLFIKNFTVCNYKATFKSLFKTWYGRNNRLGA